MNFLTDDYKIPKDVLDEVENELEELFKDEPRYMGFCHVYWGTKKKLLKNKGYDWKSPQELNPWINFD